MFNMLLNKNKIMDYFTTLGLRTNSSEKEIKKVYRELCLRWHPDRNTDVDTTGQFQLIQDVYEKLLLFEIRILDAPVKKPPKTMSQRSMKKKIITDMYPNLQLTKKNLKKEIQRLNPKQKLLDDLNIEQLMDILIVLKNK